MVSFVIRVATVRWAEWGGGEEGGGGGGTFHLTRSFIVVLLSLRALAAKMDADQNGLITDHELRHWLKRNHLQYIVKRARQFFADTDENDDDLVSFEEYERSQYEEGSEWDVHRAVHGILFLSILTLTLRGTDTIITESTKVPSSKIQGRSWGERETGAKGETPAEGEERKGREGKQRFFSPPPAPSVVVSPLAPVSPPPHDPPLGL